MQPMPPLAVIGPSGCGKSTAVRGLAERGIVRVHPTWTTRPRRPDEREGSLEHRFVGDDEFDELDRAGFFAGSIDLFGLPYRYGLPHIERSGDRTVDAVMLRAPLVQQFAAVIEPPLVYQVEDDLDRAAARLAARSSGLEDLEARLSDNRRELELGRSIAHRAFVNDGTIDSLVDAIAIALVVDLDCGAAA